MRPGPLARTARVLFHVTGNVIAPGREPDRVGPDRGDTPRLFPLQES